MSLLKIQKDFLFQAMLYAEAVFRETMIKYGAQDCADRFFVRLCKNHAGILAYVKGF